MLIKRKEISPLMPPDEKEMTVRLKNFGGITPSVYLRIFLGAFGILLFFLIFFLPGIINHGLYLTVSSQPKGATVTINDHYAGTTPTRIFLPGGKSYKIVVTRGNLPSYTETIEAKGRTFATLFFPVKHKIHIPWSQNEDMESFAANALARFCDYALADREYEAAFRKYAARSLNATFFFTQELEFFVEDFKDFLPKEEIERYILKAIPLCTHPVTVQSVVKSYSILHNISEKKAAAQLESAFKEAKKELSLEKFSRKGEFFQMGERWVHFVSVEEPQREFWIQEREVTVALYNRFLRENPHFNRENLEELEKEGLADSFYMRNFPSNASLPAVSVSWHGARAFCNWIENQAAFKGYKARLPYSFELESLAQGDNSQWANLESSSLRAAGHSQPSTLKDITGNAWEWCQNPPLKGAALKDEFLLNLPTEIKAVAGGSFKTPRDEKAFTGSLLGIWSSPYTGFRVVLEKK